MNGNPVLSRNRAIARWIAMAICVGLLLVVIFEARTISQFRHENDLLCAQSQSAPAGSPTQAAPAATSEGVEVAQSQKDRTELLRLRNEVRQLREQIALVPSNAPPAPAQNATLAAPPTQSHSDEIRQL